jgi:hypothetical protein
MSELQCQRCDVALRINTLKIFTLHLHLHRNLLSFLAMQKSDPPRPYRSYAKGLPEHIQAQLIEDIEIGGGGIYSKEDFHSIYNERVEIYGEGGSDLRQQVKSKVSYWKRLPFEEYLLIAQKLRIEINQDSYPDFGRNQQFATPSKPSPQLQRATPTSSSRMASRHGYCKFLSRFTIACLILFLNSFWLPPPFCLL